MAKVHGRAPLPLPDSLLVALQSMGYHRINPDGWEAPLYRHEDRTELFVEVSASNMPGDDAVIARWLGQKTTRLKVDLLIARLMLQLHIANSPISPMSYPRKDNPA